MGNVFNLEILATDHPFYSGECEELVFPTVDGLAGLLPNHEPMVTILVAGEIKFRVNGVWKYAAVSDGYIEMVDNNVTVLADSVELPEEIDRKRAEAAKMRAEERLKQKESLQEFYHTQAALNRAMNRLKVSSRHFKN